MLRKPESITVDLPCLPYVAEVLRRRYPDGLPMNRKDEIGRMLHDLASQPREQNYPLSDQYTEKVKVITSSEFIWRKGERVFNPETIVRFNMAIRDQLLTLLCSKVAAAQEYTTGRKKDVILLFMNDQGIAQVSTFDMWKQAVFRNGF